MGALVRFSAYLFKLFRIRMSSLSFPRLRLDPLQGLQPYAGHFNILNVHYIASTVLLGAFGPVLALVSLLAPPLAFLVRSCMRKIQPPRPERFAGTYAAHVAWLAILVGGAVCVWVSGPRTVSAIDDVIDQAALDASSTLGIIQTLLGNVTDLKAQLSNVTSSVESVSTGPLSGINHAAGKVHSLINTYQRTAKTYVGAISQASAIAGGVLLAATLASGAAASYPWKKPWRSSLVSTAIVGWVIVPLIWLLAGVVYVLSVVISDGCAAASWIEASPSTSGLSAEVPCFAPGFANTSMSTAYRPTYEAVASVNTILGACTASGPVGVGLVCSPVTHTGASTYQPGPCAPGHTVALLGFSGAYNASTCPDVPTSQLETLGTTCATIQRMYEVGQSISPIANCDFALQALHSVTDNCGSLLLGLRLLFSGLIICAVGFSAVLATSWYLTKFRSRSKPVVGAPRAKDVYL